MEIIHEWENLLTNDLWIDRIMSCPWQFKSEVLSFIYATLKDLFTKASPHDKSYFEGNQHWANLCIFRDTWPHTLCTWPPAASHPTVAPHTRSSRLGTWRSTPQSYVELCWRWGKLRLEASSCTHVFSEKHVWLLVLFYTCNTSGILK